jgi:hypothetical protein
VDRGKLFIVSPFLGEEIQVYSALIAGDSRLHSALDEMRFCRLRFSRRLVGVDSNITDAVRCGRCWLA